MRDLADRGPELAPVDPVRLPPEIRHLGQLPTQRYERAQRMDEPPCHALDLKLLAVARAMVVVKSRPVTACPGKPNVANAGSVSRIPARSTRTETRSGR